MIETPFFVKYQKYFDIITLEKLVDGKLTGFKENCHIQHL